MAGIDLECEKAMIQFIFYHRAIRFADLDTVWKAFLEVYPFPAEDEIKAWDLKLHFLCMDLSSNLWDLDEEVFLYAKYPDVDEEEEPEIQRPKTSEFLMLSISFLE